ncbi:hypothetical protein JVT61DRAFT_6100 [Boletus reticuloceps]|uniref:Uncharacterized protein n=1 Tax=Boletus reticuloceps TaxID=495285 RepID=A0A8I3A8G0_9AGAM|nr:hypothetical protein JVT61DRAFT_6100 [Boletus reticuloceps]
MPQVLFKITPAMYEDSVMDILFSLAEKRISSTRFFQLLKLTPAGEGEDIEDDWLDLVDILLDRGAVGFQEIQDTLLAHYPNASFRQRTSSSPNCVAFPPHTHQAHTRLRQDPAAWRIVWDWAAGVFEFPQLLGKLKATFGASFIEAEWSLTFNAIFDASIPNSDDEQSQAALAENSAPLPVPAPVRVVKDPMEVLGVSIGALHMFVPPPHSRPKDSNRRAPSRTSRCLAKHCKTSSIFLNISASEGHKDEDEDEDEDEDVARSNFPLQVLPAGQAHYTQDIQCIIARYEEHQPPTPLSLALPLEPHHPALRAVQGVRLYIVEFPTKTIVNFCRTIFENRGLQCQVVTSLPNKVYVEAISPLQIRDQCPSSHTSTI